MRRRNWVIAAAVVAVAILIWALRGERPAPSVPTAAPPVAASPPPPPPPAAAPETAKPPAPPKPSPNIAQGEWVYPAPQAPEGKVAVIEGEVDFTGTQPSPGKLHREADPYCARREMTDPAVLVNDGKLANVWVHVTKGAPDAPTPAGPVEMNQKDCMYVPRVAAAVVGQKTIARNGDPILHNVHAYLGSSTLFNRGMPNEKAVPLEYVLNQEGVVKWKCDVHPWMRGYLGVSRNNLQAVTGAAGAFRIENVPPGRYTLEAWHEKYGAKSQEVTVQPGVPVKVNFRFDGTEKI